MDPLPGIAADLLSTLTQYPDRHVGGEGNRAATTVFEARAHTAGASVHVKDFACIEWRREGASVEVDGVTHPLLVGPYSLACDATAPLVVATRVEDLESEAVSGAIVLICDGLAAGQIMPTNFTFYNPAEHRRIVAALAEFAPAGVIAATGRDPQMVGSQYPFPLFEDGDLDTPNSYCTDVEGEALRTHAGEHVRLRIDSWREPSTATHVVATLPGDLPGRIVVSAHIDSREGSPGALDNASGVVTLLLMMELLAGRSGLHSVEFVPFNGEDHYANPGELLWIAQNEGRFDDIVLGINIDDSGQAGAANHVSFYGCPPSVEAKVRAVMEPAERIEEGSPWAQGDHMILVMNDVPAIAVASSDMQRFMAEYAHSERDTIELADPELIARTARFLAEVVSAVSSL